MKGRAAGTQSRWRQRQGRALDPASLRSGRLPLGPACPSVRTLFILFKITVGPQNHVLFFKKKKNILPFSS